MKKNVMKECCNNTRNMTGRNMKGKYGEEGKLYLSQNQFREGQLMRFQQNSATGL